MTGGIAAGSVEPTLTYEQKNGTAIFHFKLKNQTERVVTYHFTTSQRYDYKIETTDGELVKQYSKDRMFTQVLGDLKLKQAEEADFTSKVSDLSPGKYKITFWLTAKEDGPQASLNFTVK